MITINDKNYNWSDYKDFVETLLNQEKDFEGICFTIINNSIIKQNSKINNEFKEYLECLSQKNVDKARECTINLSSYYVKAQNLFDDIYYFTNKSKTKSVRVKGFMNGYSKELEIFYNNEITDYLKGVKNETN